MTNEIFTFHIHRALLKYNRMHIRHYRAIVSENHFLEYQMNLNKSRIMRFIYAFIIKHRNENNEE